VIEEIFECSGRYSAGLAGQGALRGGDASVLKAAFVVAEVTAAARWCAVPVSTSPAHGSSGDVRAGRRKRGTPDRREATDFVILVMNDRGASSLLKSKVKLGADAAIAAGRRAATRKRALTRSCAPRC